MKITKDQMDIIVTAFNKMIFHSQMKEKRIISNALNSLMRQKYEDPKTEDYMFGFQDFDCWITFNHVSSFKNLIIVSFYRRASYIHSKKGKIITSEFSHHLSFSEFCYLYHNPDIIHDFEKILFELI